MLATLRMSTLLGTALLCMSPFAAAGRSGYNPGRTVTRHSTPSLRLGGGIGLRLGKARVSIGFGVRQDLRCCSTRPGHYRTVSERIWVQGPLMRTWVPARYEWRQGSYGALVQVLVQAGYHQSDFGPGHYETCSRRVWVPARTICSRRIHIH